MRAVLGIVSVLLVLAMVGLLAKKQLASTRSAVPVLVQPAADTPNATGVGAAAPPSVYDQSQKVQQQYKQAVEGLMQQARPMPDDVQ